MEAKELMIGDWVKYGDRNAIIKSINYDRCFILVGGYSGDELLEETYDNIEPVSLDRKFNFELNGFTDGEYRSYCENVWRLKLEGFRDIGFTYGSPEGILWGEKINPKYPHSVGDRFHVPNIKYVHELQHALRLCGIDKEIVL